MERDCAEDLLRLLSATVDQTDQALAISDPTGHLRLVNPAFAALHACTPEELRGKHFSVLHNDEQLPAAEDANRLAEQSGEFHGELWCVRGDGSLFPAFTRISILGDGSAGVMGVLRTAVDITDRKPAETALHASDERYRMLVETIPHGIQEIDTNGTIIFANRANHRMLGYEDGELVGTSFLDLLESEASQEELRAYLEMLVREQPAPTPYCNKNRTKDGQIIDVQIDWTYKRNNQGGVDGFVSVITDITERTQAEEERDRLFGLSLDMICLAGLDGYFKRINPAFERALGWSLDELMAKPFIEFVHPDDRAATLAEIDKLASGVTTLYFENRYRCKDGSYRRLVWTSVPDVERGLLYAVARDMTEPKRMEDALRESEMRQGLILRSLPMALYTADVEDNFPATWVSEQIEQLSGFSPERWVGDPEFWVSGLHPDDRERALREYSALREHDKVVTEYRWRCADGRYRWFLDQAVIARGEKEGPKLAIGTWLDITERKKVAEELEMAKEVAEAASRAKSVFLANLSHEVRTPIMALLGAAEMAGKTLDTPSSGLNQRDIILRNGRYLQSLFDNLLDAARLESGKFSARLVDCSLLEILCDVRAMCGPLRRKRGVDFRISCDGPIPSQVHTDPTRLSEALTNLISNALKFTDAGHVYVTVRVDRLGDEPRLSIEVEDTGCGISEADLERIFDMFEQGDPRPRPDFGGVGLGLPLARSIACELGGALQVQSRLGRGSIFTLRVTTGPVHDAEWIGPGEIMGPRLSPAADARALPRLKGSVLLAEDARDLREIIGNALGGAGASVTAVENGEQAVKAAAEQTYDLILMDIRMPVMHGTSAAAELRRRGCLTPIVALTANVTEEDHQHLSGYEFDDLWAKPISLDELLERCATYLESPAVDSAGLPSCDSGVGLPQASAEKHASLVAEFARGLPARFQAIEQAVNAADIQAARERLHQLAGTAGTMGFMPVSVEAGRILAAISKEGTLQRGEGKLRALEGLISDITQSPP